MFPPQGLLHLVELGYIQLSWISGSCDHEGLHWSTYSFEKSIHLLNVLQLEYNHDVLGNDHRYMTSFSYGILLVTLIEIMYCHDTLVDRLHNLSVLMSYGGNKCTGVLIKFLLLESLGYYA